MSGRFQGRVHIIGGSLGGLMAGLILRRKGYEVDIHERSPTPLSGRGAGIASHRMLRDALAAADLDVDAAALGVHVDSRRVLDVSGAVVLERPFPQLLTSWDRLFQMLRGAYPESRYHLGASFKFFLQKGDAVEVELADGRRMEGNLLIGADGFRSTVRDALLGPQEPAYAGYIAWRGMVDEDALSPQTHAALFDSFSFCLPEGEQMLGYPVAGPNNDLRPGRRRYNFVWYRPAARGQALDGLLTDAVGHRHAISIPPPLIRPGVISEMREAADRTLAPAFAEVVMKTQAPFLQPIYDFAAPRLVEGRVALIGDAAFVARPHVGAGVAKAGADAMALGFALSSRQPAEAALAAYEAARLPIGRRIVDQARELGAYMQAQQASPDERRHAAANRRPEAVAEQTASLRFLDAIQP
jgi:2-polyprenyl-6-methoxyphenol hydroxylase-like FAD-dependent oxidoreductase